MDSKIYFSVKQIVDSGKYPFTMGQMRHLLVHRHRNGLQEAVRKIGKKIILRMDLFEKWIDSHRE